MESFIIGTVMLIGFYILGKLGLNIFYCIILSVLIGGVGFPLLLTAIHDLSLSKEEREKENAESRRVAAEMIRIDNEIEQSIALRQAGLIQNSSQNKCKLCGQPVPDGIEICYVCMRHMH